MTKVSKKAKNLKALSVVLCAMLVAAAAISAVGCKKVSKYEPGTTVSGGEYGEGATAFSFNVVDGTGKEYPFTIHTDEKTVASALLKLGLVEGDDGPYGLYIKKVNGIVADYDVDGTYWAFYIDGEYALTGADMTVPEAGRTYTFKVEK